MIDKTVKVTFNELDIKEFPVGTSLKTISDSFKQYYNYDILVAKVDNDIMDLSDTITKKCNVNFYDRSSALGHNIYNESAHFMLILAIQNLFGKDVDVIIEHSIDKGVYCTVNGVDINKSTVKKIEEEMYKISESDYLFTKMSVSRIDAIKYFKKHKKFDKAKVLKYISNTYINLYRINDLYDYFYEKMAYSTKQINEFKLTYIKDNGFVLSTPTVVNPECTLDYVHHEKVFNKFLEYNTIGKNIGINNASDLNLTVSTAKIGDLIRLSEACYDNQLVEVADNIKEKQGKIKLILLAGPSSSGKTTTAKKLVTYLKSRGLNIYQLSTDDYFVNKVDTPKNANGEYDFESIKCVDIELFNKHLINLFDGKEVEIPTYNFSLGKREYRGNRIQLKEDDIIIVEGIHALNDTLTMSVDRKNKYKIYISALTHLNIDNHSYIHTSDIRKLRRIVRDSKTRGYGPGETLKMWPAITSGEESNIYPYQDEVDIVINSALIYEVGALKTYVEPLLFCVSEDSKEYPEALRLINFLRNFLPIPSDDIPANSVLREFIGGSCFKN